MLLKIQPMKELNPLSPIMEMLKDRFDSFSFRDEDINMIETAKMCYDNKMYQQGLTILEEGNNKLHLKSGV